MPGNGLTDSVSPEEIEPLRKKRSGYREEMMDIGPDGAEMNDGLERLSKNSKSISSGGSSGILQNLAYKLKIGTKRGLLYLIVCLLLILLLFLIIIILAVNWPKDYSQTTCESPQCHLFSAKVSWRAVDLFSYVTFYH